ncbi:MAG: glycosyltransferase family 9 protein [Caulobacterales bacterium]
MNLFRKKESGWRPAPRNAKRVLIIKLGALGDFIQSIAAAKVIRDYHVGARITLLTTEPFKAFADECPFFDIVEDDGRPREAQATTQLIARIRAAKYDMVYDLQTSNRTSTYYHALRPWPPLWSGIAPGCSHPHANPDRANMHTLDRIAEQLAYAGLGPEGGWDIGAAPLPDLSWVRTSLRDAPRLQPGYFGIRGPFGLIIPGASPHRPEKRWPVDRYIDLAKRIAARGVTPAVIGASAEKDIGAEIVQHVPEAKNLVSRTDLFQIATLAERALFAVGNDTGPMHIAAAGGVPCVVLFSADSDPSRVAPRGARGALCLLAKDLNQMPVEQVDQQIRNLGVFPQQAHA